MKSSLMSSGVKHMLYATFWFALMNAFVKLLAHLPTMELVFFRCGIATVIGFISLYRAKVDWIGSNRLLLFLRGTFGTIALFTFFYTLQHMPLGTAVAIQYLSPVFTAIFAIFLLKEKVRPVQWFYFMLSFSGVLLIKGIDTKISWELLSVGIISAIFSALAYNMVRTMREREHPLVVVLHFQLLGAVAGGIVSVFDWQMPEGMDWVYLLLVGVFTQLGQEHLTRSLQLERIAKVSILNYLGIVYALLFGWILFDEIHPLVELLGIVLVIAGVVLNVFVSSGKVNPEDGKKEVEIK
jgi:drug/metabolite transporter (DMT)-like permease